MDQQNSGVIQSIFLSEFNDIQGPVIVFQYPDNHILQSIEIFNVSDYLIPKPELCGKIIKLEFLDKYYIICMPVEIKHDRYRRKKHEFSISLIVTHDAYQLYDSLLSEAVRKITHFFIELEMNNQVIYNNDIPLISKILKKIYTNLNESKECMIMTDSFNFLYLVLLSPENYLSEPPEIKDYEVPVPLQDLKKLTARSEMLDPVFMYLIAEIDGEKYVKRIADDLQISLDNIKRYIQNLVYYNLVTMVDIFQFNNIYTVTNNIHSFNSDLKLQDEGVEFVVKDEYSDRFGREDLLKLYLKLSKKITIKDFVLQFSDTVIKINMTKFVQFGLMKKLIRRMHEYPIKLKPTDYPLMTKKEFLFTE